MFWFLTLPGFVKSNDHYFEIYSEQDWEQMVLKKSGHQSILHSLQASQIFPCTTCQNEIQIFQSVTDQGIGKHDDSLRAEVALDSTQDANIEITSSTKSRDVVGKCETRIKHITTRTEPCGTPYIRGTAFADR